MFTPNYTTVGMITVDVLHLAEPGCYLLHKGKGGETHFPQPQGSWGRRYSAEEMLY